MTGGMNGRRRSGRMIRVTPAASFVFKDENILTAGFSLVPHSGRSSFDEVSDVFHRFLG